jgi:glycosyltransferase involved in cell wall biosynthesis
MRLAWFSPVPPAVTGVAAYTAELVPLLAARHEIDVFVDFGESAGLERRAVCRAQAAAEVGARVLNAHEFPWRHIVTPYDLIVYQAGNSSWHDYIWPYLFRHPGLTVLHDGHLHHSRAGQLLRRGRRNAYRAEFAYNHPDARPEVAEFAVAGLAGAPYYFWPMLRIPVRASRVVAVHNDWLAADLREREPDAAVTTITMGVADSAAGTWPAAAAEQRARAGIPVDATLFAAFGLVTPEKRISQAIQGLAAILPDVPEAWLALVGEAVAHYDALAEARAAGVGDRVVVLGHVPDEALPAWLHAADVCLCQRWPSARETSASWLRCLSAGRPTIATDLLHTVEVPGLDPRDWSLLHASPPEDGAGGRLPEPVAVKIDILDEDHSLRLAMKRLGRDAALRQRLGRNARRYWEERHTLERMREGYEAAMAEAVRRPAPVVDDLPAHLTDEAMGRVRTLLAPFGMAADHVLGRLDFTRDAT